jgi:hypothetical protein
LTDAAVRLWPTPAASTPNDGEEPETWLERAAGLKEKHQNGNGVGMPLAIAAKLWHTPTAAEGLAGVGEHTTRGGASNLRTQVSLWATPTARDVKGEFTGHRNGGKDLPGQAKGFRSGLPDPTTSPAGSESAKRVLNPPFVEWLMGWPIGWTDCTSSATVSFRSWRRSRSSALRDVLVSWRWSE